MKSDQKLLFLAGGVLIVVSGLYIASASVPSTAVTATLFPLSILGFFFGLALIIWAVAWLALQKAKLVK